LARAPSPANAYRESTAVALQAPSISLAVAATNLVIPNRAPSPVRNLLSPSLDTIPPNEPRLPFPSKSHLKNTKEVQ
jgi:hypothetical protein